MWSCQDQERAKRKEGDREKQTRKKRKKVYGVKSKSKWLTSDRAEAVSGTRIVLG